MRCELFSENVVRRTPCMVCPLHWKLVHHPWAVGTLHCCPSWSFGRCHGRKWGQGWSIKLQEVFDVLWFFFHATSSDLDDLIFFNICFIYSEAFWALEHVKCSIKSLEINGITSRRSYVLWWRRFYLILFEYCVLCLVHSACSLFAQFTWSKTICVLFILFFISRLCRAAGLLLHSCWAPPKCPSICLPRWELNGMLSKGFF